LKYTDGGSGQVPFPLIFPKERNKRDGEDSGVRGAAST